MSQVKAKLGTVLKQYRIEHLVQNDKMYKQVSILNEGLVVFRGEKIGREIGRKRQFMIDTNKYPNTLIFTRQLLLQGCIGIVPKELNGCIVTENMPTFSIEGIEPEFLTFYLKTELFNAQVRRLETTGTAQKSLHERQFLELEIPLPCPEEQRKIISYFNAVKDYHKEIEAEIISQKAYLQQLRQSILQEAVQGKLTQQDPTDEPGGKLLERIKAEKQRLISSVKLKREKPLPPITPEEIPFDLPEGWAFCKLGEVCDLITDGTHLTPNYVEKGRVFLSAQNVKPFRFLPQIQKFVSQEDYDGYVKNRKAVKGDVLLTRVGAGIGEAAVIDIDLDFAFYVSLCLLKPTREVLFSKYLEIFLNSPLGRKHSSNKTLGKGFSAGNLNLGLIRNFQIPLPPFHEQSRIVKRVQELNRLIDQLEQGFQQSLTMSQQLMQTVLKEAFEIDESTTAILAT